MSVIYLKNTQPIQNIYTDRDIKATVTAPLLGGYQSTISRVVILRPLPPN